MSRVTQETAPMTLQTRGRSIVRMVVLLTVSVLVAGCATYKHEFDGQPIGQVWSSMVAAARTPSYDGPSPSQRWTVIDNEVWVDEDLRRIEIYRRLARRLYQGAQPLDENRVWNFRVSLIDEDPPTVKFVGRGLYIYAHVDAEAQRYFTDMNDLLSIEPSPPAADD
jgi:hypothetical protein